MVDKHGMSIDADNLFVSQNTEEIKSSIENIEKCFEIDSNQMTNIPDDAIRELAREYAKAVRRKRGKQFSNTKISGGDLNELLRERETREPSDMIDEVRESMGNVNTDEEIGEIRSILDELEEEIGGGD